MDLTIIHYLGTVDLAYSTLQFFLFLIGLAWCCLSYFTRLAFCINADLARLHWTWHGTILVQTDG